MTFKAQVFLPWSQCPILMTRVDRIGVHDSFFALGGHSLLIAQLVYQVKQHFNKVVPLKAIFENPIFIDLASIIENNEDSIHITKTGSTLELIEKDLKTGALVTPKWVQTFDWNSDLPVLLTGGSGFLGFT
jgi:hypothetical protein